MTETLKTERSFQFRASLSSYLILSTEYPKQGNQNNSKIILILRTLMGPEYVIYENVSTEKVRSLEAKLKPVQEKRGEINVRVNSESFLKESPTGSYRLYRGLSIEDIEIVS